MPGSTDLSIPGRRRTARRAGQLLGAALSVAAVFAIAGTLRWWNAWALFVLMAVLGWATSKAFGRSPGLADERRTASSKALRWDRVVVRLLGLVLPAMLLLAALERRFAWISPAPLSVSRAAFALMVAAAVATHRAIVVNPFFSSYVRIQEDRGHAVVAAGPYRVVRHPGYAGAIGFNLFLPVALGSWIAAPVGVGAALLLAYRTAKEDAILSAELPGYADYAKDVRHRLIPWVW